MEKLSNISFRSLLILLGVITAFVVINEPIMHDHINQATCQTELEEKSTDESSTEQVSTLEIVTPVHQIQNVSTDYYILEEFTLEQEPIHQIINKSLKKVRDEFVRILFNFIIAPNAP